MKDKKNNKEYSENKNIKDSEATAQEAAENQPEIVDVADTDDENGNPILGGESEVEALKNLLNSTQEDLEAEKKKYLFLMAEFDNFRKRVVKEKADLIKNATEKAMSDLLPIVDDFERGLQAVKSTDDDTSVVEGMELIYNKFVKYLNNQGVKAMETTGNEFDADTQEAIATVPAPSDDMKGKVIDTTTKGYTINDKVLRHAQVVVGE